MFTKLFNPLRFGSVRKPVKNEQQTLDKLRITYEFNPAMQLHFDRMQTALNAQA